MGWDAVFMGNQGAERHCKSTVFPPRTQYNFSGQGSSPEHSTRSPVRLTLLKAIVHTMRTTEVVVKIMLSKNSALNRIRNNYLSETEADHLEHSCEAN